MIDVEAKMKSLYMFAKQKPSQADLEGSLDALVQKGYLVATTTDAYVYWTITTSGINVLAELLDGEEVDI